MVDKINLNYNEENSHVNESTTTEIFDIEDPKIGQTQASVKLNENLWQKLKKILLSKLIIYLFWNIVVLSYFSYATYVFISSEQGSSTVVSGKERCHGKCGFQWCNGYGMLLLLIIFGYFGAFYYKILKPILNRKIDFKLFCSVGIKSTSCFYRISLSAIFLVIIAALSIFLYYQTYESTERLIGLIAPALFILFGYIFSTEREAINWRTVITGIGSQFILGVICIRWELGRNIFECIGNKVATFLSYTNEGTIFVYGIDINKAQVFAFTVLPMIFLFSFSISILYYLNIMQIIIFKLGLILQKCLGTTVCESVNAAANIFLGMTESPLLIRPYIKHLTRSELHAIMVSGFSTVSGTVLAAYISFGAEPANLITSSIMAAPASLAMAKLFYPENEKSQTQAENIQVEKSKDSSIVEAATNGALLAIEMILGIIANIIAFLSFIAFLNGIVNWIGYLIGFDDITFEWLFAKLFIPLSWAMGIPWNECDTVAKVIATKTIINEFVAYEKLGEFTKQGLLTARSNAIATFAICGFANPGSIGILIGSLGTLSPEKRPLIATIAFKAFVVGSIVCFTSASFAGILMDINSFNNTRNGILNEKY